MELVEKVYANALKFSFPPATPFIKVKIVLKGFKALSLMEKYPMYPKHT